MRDSSVVSEENSPNRKITIREMPEDERPRERMLRHGPGSLTDAELIAVFLRTGMQGKSAIDMARELIREHGSLAGLSKCGYEELQACKGLGLAKASQLLAALEMGKRLAVEKASDKRLDRPEEIHQLLAPMLSHLQKESLRVVLLSTKLTLMRVEEISLGSHNESVAHPAQILRPVLLHSAHGFVMAHNHPSGDPTPSEADRRLTTRMVEAASLMSVKFLDHVVIGRPTQACPEGYFSFRENCLM
jgi:DNA repair protein RadC